MSSPGRFAGRLAVVVGGASGIGAAAARELVRGGAQVVVADLDATRAASLAQELAGGTPGAAHAVAVDVRERGSVEALFCGLPRPADIVVTSAGGASRSAAFDTDEATFAAALQLNAGGFWRCAQVAARAAVAAARPLAIVHVASSLHRGPAPGLAHFAAAKAASVTLVRCLAQEWAAHAIRVNAVVPGPVETPMTTPVWDAAPGLRAAIRASLPLGRIGEPADVARAIAWLASDEAAWITGTLLPVDGGLEVAR
ncbi:MAG: SDR family oxidoreductase [Steroidobacteraceae bacterium]|jgi:NAD(P)-dependent dehydrogenase (short-subunit alcohol dehydrogenase family)|nr:SDR family oxidoreductase [Steroidobacteraceae bacterium]